MNYLGLLVLCLTIILGYVNCAPEADLVTDLPGLKWTPNFKHFSGYLNGTGTQHLHYWFVESSSNPRTDPVVMWTNGGPGCSSMEGMLSEHGPFRIESDGITISRNPFAWNQVANIIYLEAPAGVGYSYDDTQQYSTDDDKVAASNLAAMKDFFIKFPEYKDNDFYVSGESYGGIYVPTLVDAILKDGTINIKGFLVGNGLSDWNMDMNSIIYFAYYHGLIGDFQFDTILSDCCNGNKSLSCDFMAGSNRSVVCKDYVAKIQNLVWNSGLNVYNMYAECAGGVPDSLTYFNRKKGKFVTSKYVLPYFGRENIFRENDQLKTLLANKDVKSSIPCTDDFSIHHYMNQPAVREALHISPKALEWELCSNTVSSQYKTLYATMAPQYQRALAKKLRIYVYNGDIDMACNFLGDEWFVDSLHDQSPKERVKWYYTAADSTKQVAGFYKEYEHITFITVRGAGHMVPTDRPRPALKLFVSFIQDTQL